MKKTRLSLPACASLVASLAAVLSAACSANFKDGETTCSLQNTCPEGFACDVNGGRKCRKTGSVGTPDAGPGPGPGPTPTQPDAASNPPRPDAGPGPTPGSMCRANDATDKCAVCLAEKCCPEFQACRNNPSCQMLVACAQKCAMGDMACIQACIQMHPNGVQPVVDYDMCGDNKCTAECM